jgi:tetratricopeptide (TPR) repeat protein
MGRLNRMLTAITGRLRALTPAQTFLKADRCRREGRLEAAAQLIAAGLEQSPNHASGHLLAAYVHAASHRLDAAKAAFQQVLTLERDNPRAFLGLARVALEEGDLDASRRHLEQALRLYPDFLEARALLDVVTDRSAGVGETSPTEPALPTERFKTLVGTRDVMLARTDGAVVFGQLASGGHEQLATLLGRTVRMASATLARAGLGAARRGVIDASSGMLVVRSEAGLILSLACPDTVQPGVALLEVNRLWAGALLEPARTP